MSLRECVLICNVQRPALCVCGGGGDATGGGRGGGCHGGGGTWNAIINRKMKVEPRNDWRAPANFSVVNVA